MEIGFHIPDILFHHRLNIILYESLTNDKERFRDGAKIASVYGVFPSAMWNGGRFSGGQPVDEKTMRMFIEDYNSRGIPVRYTFTNPLIEKEHLGNHYCNQMLRAANNGMNEVIINSPLLEDYIREHYPNFKITSSTCKEIRTPEGVNAELAKDYNLVVLDYNWNNNFEFLESIKEKDRCEILVNACCIPNCKRRGEHYKNIGMQQIQYADQVGRGEKQIKVCESIDCQYVCQSLYKTLDYPTHISPEAIWEKYAPMGFSHFKLEGRTNQAISVLENYIYYMAKPEHRDSLRLDMAQWLTEKVKFFM
ncbi:MAG: hypothetical protein IJZ72_01585 [Oscillospiraceae bacterium]|nr:hypothetical protein [Oscillospiraceae bacterium]